MVAIPLLSVVVFGVMVITRPLYKSVQTRLDRVLGLTRENLTGVRVVRAFDKEKSEVDRFEDANELLTKMQLHVGHISALMNPLTYVIINLAIVALLYVGSIEISIGGMASGDVIALVNYMNQILVELVKLANLIVQVSKALACAGRVQAVLDTKPGMEFPAQLTGNVPAEKAGDAVCFDHVSLTYKGAGAPSLSDISFTARRGQTIGVIGGTGSGKSTSSSLIPASMTPPRQCGDHGRPVRQYPRADLRGKVAVVMQKAQLFGGTIRSNLLWGSQNASDADLWAALETAQAAEFVKAKPLGLDEPVEQGGRNLSGGQKQRLTIAPRPRRQAGYPHPRRQRQRTGLRHRRGPAEGSGRSAGRSDCLHRQPACRQPAARRPDHRAGRWPHGGPWPSRRAAGKLPGLQGNL